MKNWIVYIAIFILSGSQMIAQSVEIPKDPAMADLHESSLGKRQLATYEQQALLKFQDLLDYTSIIGSEKYNSSMRKAALKSVLGDFDQAARIDCDWIDIGGKSSPKKERKKGEKHPCSPQQILEELSETANYEVQAVYQNMKIRESLIRSGNGTYKGQLQCTLYYKTKDLINSERVVEQAKQICLMDFELRRIQKKFGKEKEVVWEVRFLGME